MGSLFTPENYANAADLLDANTDPSKPKAFLNYILFNEEMQVVGSFTGSFQATGDGDWTATGTQQPLVIPANGYLAVYLDNASLGDVFFDQLQVRFTRGNLKEETHYYPFGLPMGDIGSAAVGFTLNRRKYQSNEYIKDAGLKWMNFHARQFDPQIGRFMGVDPLAASGGQDRLSPYAAMGDEPAGVVDPGGMQYEVSATALRYHPPDLNGGLLPSVAAFLGLPYYHDSYNYGAYFDQSCDAFEMECYVDAMEAAYKAMVQDENENTSAGGGGGGTIAINMSSFSTMCWYDGDGDGKPGLSGDGGNGGDPPTKEEADEHYMNGNGEPMYVDLSKVDLKFLDPTDFNEKKWTTKVVQTLGRSKDGKTFGHITLTYLGNNQVRATLGYDDYDYEMHPWSNPGNWIRNFETIIGEPGQGTGFRIYLIGTGTISPLPQWRQDAYQMINQFESYFLPYK